MESEKNNWVFIVNPVAGNGSAKLVLPVLESMISLKRIKAEIVFTEKPGHASELSESYYNKGTKYIIGIGGDGTLNEIARPIINKNDVTIGIIPAGTGNDLIQILGFPGRFEKDDWEVFFRASEIKMDTGVCNGKIFLNGMGLGFDAEVAAENYTSTGEVKKGWKYKYIWHIIKTLLFFKEKKVISVNETDRTESDCFINTIANGRRFAGGFFLTPLALANDGLLDVCMIKKLSLPERFNILFKVPKGTHITDKRVNYYTTKTLKLQFPKLVPYHVDGEIFFDREFEVKVLPGALNTIYNPDGNHYFRK